MELTFFHTMYLSPRISISSVSNGDPLAVSCRSTDISSALRVVTHSRRTTVRWVEAPCC